MIRNVFFIAADATHPPHLIQLPLGREFVPMSLPVPVCCTQATTNRIPEINIVIAEEERASKEILAASSVRHLYTEFRIFYFLACLLLSSLFRHSFISSVFRIGRKNCIASAHTFNTCCALTLKHQTWYISHVWSDWYQSPLFVEAWWLELLTLELYLLLDLLMMLLIDWSIE